MSPRTIFVYKVSRSRGVKKRVRFFIEKIEAADVCEDAEDIE